MVSSVAGWIHYDPENDMGDENITMADGWWLTKGDLVSVRGLTDETRQAFKRLGSLYKVERAWVPCPGGGPHRHLLRSPEGAHFWLNAANDGTVEILGVTR